MQRLQTHAKQFFEAARIREVFQQLWYSLEDINLPILQPSKTHWTALLRLC